MNSCTAPDVTVYSDNPAPILCMCCHGAGCHGGNEVGYGAYDCETCYGTGIWVVSGHLQDASQYKLDG